MIPRPQPPAWLAILLIAVILVLVYHPVPGHPFVWTDHAEVEQGALVPASLHDLGRAFTRPKGVARGTARDAFVLRSTDARYAYYRPVKALTYGIDWALGGGRPWAFHLTNLLLHAGCCVLLLFTGRRLWGERFPWLAEGLAIGHAVFPLHVEAVCWISARSDVLWGFFTLAGVLALLRSRSTPRKWPWRLGSALAVLAAAGSKESGIVGAGILLLVSSLVGDPDRPSWWKRVRVEGWAPVAAAVSYLLFRLLVVGDVQVGMLGSRAGPGGWALLHLFGLNLVQSFLPLGLRLADTLEVTHGPTWLALAGPLAWLAWLVLGLRHRRRHPVILLTALGWLLAVAPVSQVIPLLHPRGERYLYVPAMFSEILLVWLLGSLIVRSTSARVRWGLRAALVVTLSSLMLLAHVRARPWSDERWLFSLAVEDEPHCAECWNNLAYAEAVRGRYQRAAEACRHALAIDTRRYRGARDGFSLRWILSRSLLLVGRGHEALPWIRAIIRRHGPTRPILDMLELAIVQAVASGKLPPDAWLWVPSALERASGFD